MESGAIGDCDLSSSVTVDQDHGVAGLRPGSPSFWSPFLHLDQDHWIQVHLPRVSRVTRISFLAIKSRGTVTRALVQSSSNGIDWLPVMPLKRTFVTTETDRREHDVPLAGTLDHRKDPRKRTSKLRAGELAASFEVDYKQQENKKGIFDLEVDVKADFLRIQVIAFSLLPSPVGLQLQRQQASREAQLEHENNMAAASAAADHEAESDRPFVGLKIELYGCYLEARKEPATATKALGSQEQCSSVTRTQKAVGNRIGMRQTLVGREYSVNLKTNVLLVCEDGSEQR